MACSLSAGAIGIHREPKSFKAVARPNVPAVQPRGPRRDIVTDWESNSAAVRVGCNRELDRRGHSLGLQIPRTAILRRALEENEAVAPDRAHHQGSWHVAPGAGVADTNSRPDATFLDHRLS